jgi:hypothetical protein
MKKNTPLAIAANSRIMTGAGGPLGAGVGCVGG